VVPCTQYLPGLKKVNMKNEGDVKAEVKRVFGEANAHFANRGKGRLLWWFMPSANGFGRAGIPDFVGMLSGQPFAVETKFGAGQLTPHQMREIEGFTQAGGKVWIVRETTIDEFRREFMTLVELEC